MVEITVEYHEEDGLWWAESEQVSGWAAGGDTREQARERVREGLHFIYGEDVIVDERFPDLINDLHVSATGVSLILAGTAGGTALHAVHQRVTTAEIKVPKETVSA
ncbi:hypothetical protein MXD62_19890 [Frankia sp. Mgl5]|uniref:type II toxin-antitoxin system HicB family antitoxin n=1 Tax=Frankia sp. Mgl5 TaxID=2933793 RepID=UPI0020105B72|nr:hypothetical protein [Frankia sp. Mgl5]MCK9929413.1 hypothetical protein [Frankia sp. Mgl5]